MALQPGKSGGRGGRFGKFHLCAAEAVAPAARILAVAAALVVAGAATAEAQARNSLRGTVRDEVNLRPIEGATVSILDSEQEVETDENGRFVVVDLPFGPVTVRFAKPGYGSVVERVEIGSGASGEFEVLLPRMAAMLRELRVGGSRFTSDDRHEYEVRASESDETAFDVLKDQVPGMSVFLNSGDVGEGSAIRIRGTSTILGSNWPSIYLDGIRIDTRGPEPSTRENSAPLNVLQTIPADHVERVRVLSGPAAVARFPDGANGVILIETATSARSVARSSND